jgi:osmoprotectant transport system ATP-binding protein
MDDVVRFDNVSYERAGRLLVRDVTLGLEPASVTAIVGRSGAGKTTLLRLVNGLVLPSSGTLTVEDRATREWNGTRLRRRIGYVIQEVGLFPHMTVEQNVTLVPRLEQWPVSQARERARELLDLVGLEPDTYAARRPHELSGGQRQRVGLARALAVNPPILLMDEPFGALDPITRADVRELFAGLQRRFGTTAIIVTHDIAEALTLGTRVGVMDDGRLIACDAPEQITRSADPRIQRLLATVPAGVTRPH